MKRQSDEAPLDYSAMSPGDMNTALADGDAVKWADAFCQLNPGADHVLMYAWFCNSIMCGWDGALASVGRREPRSGSYS